jgi:hypothetical protein
VAWWNAELSGGFWRAKKNRFFPWRASPVYGLELAVLNTRALRALGSLVRRRGWSVCHWFRPRQALQTKKCRRGLTRRAPTANVATVVEKNTGGESLEPRANDKGCARLRIDAGYAGTIHALDPTSVGIKRKRRRHDDGADSVSNISTTESVPKYRARSMRSCAVLCSDGNILGSTLKSEGSTNKLCPPEPCTQMFRRRIRI